MLGCTHNQGMLATHCDDCPVDDPQQRHHDILNVLKGFPLRTTNHSLVGSAFRKSEFWD